MTYSFVYFHPSYLRLKEFRDEGFLTKKQFYRLENQLWKEFENIPEFPPLYLREEDSQTFRRRYIKQAWKQDYINNARMCVSTWNDYSEFMAIEEALRDRGLIGPDLERFVTEGWTAWIVLDGFLSEEQLGELKKDFPRLRYKCIRPAWYSGGYRLFPCASRSSFSTSYHHSKRLGRDAALERHEEKMKTYYVEKIGEVIDRFCERVERKKVLGTAKGRALPNGGLSFFKMIEQGEMLCSEVS